MTKKLPKGAIELTIEVPIEEIAKELESAASRLSSEHPISGYRPGKAPYEVVKNRFSEMAIYEHALPDIVRKHYVKAVVDNGLKSYGEPSINVTRLAPGNPVSFTATVSLVPRVLTLADFRAVKVQSKTAAIEEKQVEDSLKELQRLQTTEARVNREVGEHDKIIVDMDMSLDKVPIEGGQARNHGIFLDEQYFVPGLKEQVLGMKEGEKRSFKLKFPTEHYQKQVAGKDVDFDVTVKEVYELTHPPLDDAFAKNLRQDSLQALRDLLRKNLEHEAKEKEDQRAELEMLDKLVEKSKFEDIPDLMVKNELDRMIEELKEGVAERGLKFDDYLKSIKKSVDELTIELSPQAVKRVKTALVVREIGDKENLVISDAEVLEELQKLLNAYANDPETLEKLRSDDYLDYLRTTLRNRKVIALLREAIVKK